VQETVSAAHAAGAEHTLNGARIRTRLSLAAALAAAIMLAVGIWSQLGHTASAAGSDGTSGSAQTTSQSTPTTANTTEPAPVEFHAAKYVATTSSTGPSTGSSTGQFGGPQPSFQKSLGRLNNALSVPTGRTPEQVLRDVRQRGAKAGVRLCDFEWNGGQPALVYGGGSGISLDASLNRCAAAVEDFVSAASAPNKNPGH
jgi:cytoskeletal protein RodZ